MPYSISCSTKILTLVIPPFLFILVGVLCEFAILPGMYILFTLIFLRAKMYTFNCTFIKEIQTFVCHYSFMSRLLLNRKKHKQRIQLHYAYGAYNQTK